MKTLAFLVLLLISPCAISAQNIDVCVKYRDNYSWSKAYRVQGSLISGTELASATMDYARYKIYVTYVVVFWSERESSIFELPAVAAGAVPSFDVEVEDQDGRKWMIRNGILPCL